MLKFMAFHCLPSGAIVGAAPVEAENHEAALDAVADALGCLVMSRRPGRLTLYGFGYVSVSTGRTADND